MASEAERRDAIWREIGRYLQRYVPRQGRVLDVGCDQGNFIRNITAAERWGADLRDVATDLGPEVKFVQADGLLLGEHLPGGYFDVVFMSNYLEHLPSTYSVVEQLQVVYRLVRPGGSVIVLQPNVRLVGGRYWDFIDHRVPLTDRSLVEAGHLAGFEQLALVVRFLPFTTKSRIPQDPRLVRLYLRFPPLWRVMGKQTLYVGRKPANAVDTTRG